MVFMSLDECTVVCIKLLKNTKCLASTGNNSSFIVEFHLLLAIKKDSFIMFVLFNTCTYA